MKTTIKEVYEQCLANGWLGQNESIFICGNQKFKLVGRLNISEYSYVAAIKDDPSVQFETFKAEEEVEWIGNQPKKKMLYKAMLYLSEDHYVERLISRDVMLKVKTQEMSDHNKLYSFWLPEEQYPPIEIEEEG